ncbi:MAG: AAA family ATPase, partial [Pseudomonadota bacterium]
MTVIFLNGCTSAGKSSLARALQAALPTPYLLTGIDDAFAMIPMRYHKHPEGFRFVRDDEGLVQLAFGDVGWQTLHAHQIAAAAMAHSGVNLILDEVVLNEALRSEWLRLLEGLPVHYVGVHCELAELERREQARGDRMLGQARGQFGHVH